MISEALAGWVLGELPLCLEAVSKGDDTLQRCRDPLPIQNWIQHELKVF